MAPRNKLCGVCGKTTRDFPSPRLYEEHVKKHLDQTYSCDKCDINLRQKFHCTTTSPQNKLLKPLMPSLQFFGSKKITLLVQIMRDVFRKLG